MYSLIQVILCILLWYPTDYCGSRVQNSLGQNDISVSVSIHVKTLDMEVDAPKT